MKFYGEPNQLVKERKRKQFTMGIINKPLFRFDENGEYETNDPILIEKLKRKFKYDEKSYSCKKCDFTTNNKGELLAHYKTHKG